MPNDGDDVFKIPSLKKQSNASNRAHASPTGRVEDDRQWMDQAFIQDNPRNDIHRQERPSEPSMGSVAKGICWEARRRAGKKSPCSVEGRRRAAFGIWA